MFRGAQGRNLRLKTPCEVKLKRCNMNIDTKLLVSTEEDSKADIFENYQRILHWNEIVVASEEELQ